MDEMERRYLAITDVEKCVKGEQITLYKMPFSFLAPFMEWIVPALLTARFAENLGEEYSRGFKGIWHENEDSFSTVNTKAIRSV